MMHFSLFQIPLFPTNLSDSAENFPTLTFSLQNFRFSSAKISDDFFLVVHHKFRIPPHFPVSIHFPPISGNFSFSLLLHISPHHFIKFTCFFTYFTCIFFPPTFTIMHLSITR